MPRWYAKTLFPALGLVLACISSASAQRLDELPLDSWTKLTETQRYQLQVAEKYYREKNYKVAAAEYEKYLRLYERSVAAAYAQLKWSVCHVHLRQSNTAIKDGFQSVVDYWPDSQQAIAAAYYIGSTYQGMGRIPQAKKALRAVIDDHPNHLASTYAMTHLIEIAKQEKDDRSRLGYLRKLTFEVKRVKFNRRVCENASNELATHLFLQSAFNEGVKALATSYAKGPTLDNQIGSRLTQPISTLIRDEKSQSRGEKLATDAIAYLRSQTPAATDEKQKQVALEYGFHIAALHIQARHDAEVIKTYEQLHRTFGPNDEVLRRLAEWYKSKNQYDKARAVFLTYADKLQGLSQVAYSYRQQKQVDSAVASYNQLVGQDADNAIKWKGEIGATYREAKKYQQAIDSYTGLMSEDIENAQKWRWAIASAYQDWGKYKEAIGHYRQCTNFPENYKQMAWCFRRLKNQKEALVLYAQVMSHEPSAPWALLQMGYTREEASQKEQAIKTFQQVCKRYPKHSYASTAHAHLQNKYKISVTLGGAKNKK